MDDQRKLHVIKAFHTVVWLFFNFVIFYMFYAVIANRLGPLLWIGYAIIALEVITLLVFRMSCPLTIIARRYSTSTGDNFDIYIPNWLAKNNKLIYSLVVGVTIVITIYRLFQ